MDCWHEARFSDNHYIDGYLCCNECYSKIEIHCEGWCRKLGKLKDMILVIYPSALMCKACFDARNQREKEYLDEDDCEC